MGNERAPGVLGRQQPLNINDGTMARAKSPASGLVGFDAAANVPQQVLLSPAFQNVVRVSDNLAAPMTWDAFWRAAYGRADQALQAQANALLKRGNISPVEYEALVEARNELVRAFRKPLSPFGRAYSEILKPSSRLPQPGDLLLRKGSIEAVLESVGKSRASGNLSPVVGEVTEGGLCLVGGMLGGLGVGWLSREAGKKVGETAYDFVTTFRWA